MRHADGRRRAPPIFAWVAMSSEQTYTITQLSREFDITPRAIRFYERCDFRRIGLIPAGMIHEGQEIDEVLMARRVK